MTTYNEGLAERWPNIVAEWSDDGDESLDVFIARRLDEQAHPMRTWLPVTHMRVAEDLLQRATEFVAETPRFIGVPVDIHLAQTHIMLAQAKMQGGGKR